jgi:hypothetical protein
MLARRLLFALAVLLVLTAVAAALAPRETAPREDAAAAPPPTAQPARPAVEETLDAGASGQKVIARVGQNVTIIVESDELDTVELAELGTEPVEPDSPARFDLLADAPGSYPLVLLESGRRIGVLEVRE